MVCCLLSEWCVATSFYQSSANYVSFSFFETYSTLSVGYPLGEPFLSVCGWLCGQTQIQKFKSARKVLKYKKNPAFPKEKAGLYGAATQI